MHWLRSNIIWKAGTGIAAILLLFIFMVWIPVSGASAYEVIPGLVTSTPGTVEGTPTVDPTVNALNKEQLTLQVKQLQNELQTENNWLVNNSTALIAAITAIVVAFIGFTQWAGNRRDERRKEITVQNKDLEDRKAERERRDEEQQRWLKNQEAEREKRAEERFQTVVEGLGCEREEAKVGAAIMLRTFLRPGYEQFYTQTFDLSVAHLRLPRTAQPPEDSTSPLPLTTLSQVLISNFKEAFPLAWKELKQKDPQFNPRALDASGILLDRAFLVQSDLQHIWMREASLNGAHLRGANLNGAYLRRTHLRGAFLHDADLRGTDLSATDFSGARLSRADLRGADLSETNLEDALSMKGTNLCGVKGLTKEQLAICEAKGAIIDEDATTSPPQSPVSRPVPSQSNDVQTPLAPSVPGNIPTPEIDGSDEKGSMGRNGP
jgi:hypothetical protein